MVPDCSFLTLWSSGLLVTFIGNSSPVLEVRTDGSLGTRNVMAGWEYLWWVWQTDNVHQRCPWLDLRNNEISPYLANRT